MKKHGSSFTSRSATNLVHFLLPLQQLVAEHCSLMTPNTQWEWYISAYIWLSFLGKCINIPYTLSVRGLAFFLLQKWEKTLMTKDSDRVLKGQES